MNKIIYKKALHFFLFSFTGLLLSISFSFKATGQNTKTTTKRLLDGGEMAFCEIKVANNRSTNKIQVTKKKNIFRLFQKRNYYDKILRPEPNRIGMFNTVSGIQPLEKVPIEIFYPQGSEGEKVAISVLDGGILDNNKKVKVAQLNKRKKISFHLQVTNNLGIYRLMLRKGNDTKIVQLWVGPEPTAVRK